MNLCSSALMLGLPDYSLEMLRRGHWWGHQGWSENHQEMTEGPLALKAALV
jgi:hypothetical protein